jgi:anti-sigma28 factor (negative regulator of flagellin synthesis)
MASKKILIVASTIQNMAVLMDTNIEAELEAQGIIMEVVSKLAKLGTTAKEIKPPNFNPEPEAVKDPTGDKFCAEVRRRVEAIYTEAGLSPLPSKAESMLCTDEVIKEEYDKQKDDSPADTMINMRGVERIKEKIAEGKFSPVISTKAIMGAIISALKVEEFTWESTVFTREIVEPEVEGCCNCGDPNCDHEDSSCDHEDEGLASAAESAALAEGGSFTLEVDVAEDEPDPMVRAAAITQAVAPILQALSEQDEDPIGKILEEVEQEAKVDPTIAKLEQALGGKISLGTSAHSAADKLAQALGVSVQTISIPEVVEEATQVEEEVTKMLEEAIEEAPPVAAPVPASNIDERVCRKAITRHVRCNPGLVSQTIGVEYDPDFEFPAEEDANWSRSEGIIFKCKGVEGIICKVCDDGTAITSITLEKV